MMKCTVNGRNEVGDCLAVELYCLLILLLSISLHCCLDKLRLTHEQCTYTHNCAVVHYLMTLMCELLYLMIYILLSIFKLVSTCSMIKGVNHFVDQQEAKVIWQKVQAAIG